MFDEPILHWNIDVMDFANILGSISIKLNDFKV